MKIIIYTAAIVETGSDHPFGWSLQASTPEDLAKKVNDILTGEEKERDIEIRRPDLAAMTANARYGSDGDPDVYNIDDDRYVNATFVVQYSGPMTVEVPGIEASTANTPKGTIIAAPAGEEETIDILLSEGQFPNARKAKLEELLEENVFDSREKAERWLDRTPICLELIYEKGLGLFAAESDAIESCSLLSPYSGKEVLTPDSASDKTTPEGQDADPAKKASAVDILVLDWYGSGIPYRNVNLSHDDGSDPVVVKVTRESLIMSGLIIDGSPLDDMFGFYVPDDIFNTLSDEDLGEYVNQNSN